MSSVVAALQMTDSPEHLLVLTNVVGMRFRNAKSAAPALIGLLQHPNDEVRYAVADALGKLRVATAGKAMLEALPGEESPTVRAMLLSGVGAARVREGFDQLVHGLVHRDWIVRHGAAWGLGELGDQRGLPVLSQAASTEKDPSVLRAILAAKASLTRVPG
jgi:HEAT repeat protein